MEIFLHSLWVSIRSLRATKMFTVLSLITLSLAMAGNALIFSAIYVTLLNPLSFSDPDRLVMIWETNHGAGREHDPVAPTNFFGWQTGGKPFKSMAAMSMRRYNLTGGEAVQVTGEAVSASFFPLLGVQPAMGRFFLAEEDQPGKNTSAILSNSFWQQRFGSDRNVLGKTLTLDGTNYVVVG